jgi:putative oxidoreductase
MSLVRLIARPMLSTMFIVGGVNSLRNAEHMVERAKPVTDRLLPLFGKAGPLPVEIDATRMVQINGAIHVVAGAALATGRWPRLSALVLAATLVPTTFGGHRYWEESDPQMRANQKVHFAKNVSMLGGLLIAAVDTGGRPSLAWRARHGADIAKKRATQITS